MTAQGIAINHARALLRLAQNYKLGIVAAEYITQAMSVLDEAESPMVPELSRALKADPQQRTLDVVVAELLDIDTEIEQDGDDFEWRINIKVAPALVADGFDVGKAVAESFNTGEALGRMGSAVDWWPTTAVAVVVVRSPSAERIKVEQGYSVAGTRFLNDEQRERKRLDAEREATDRRLDGETDSDDPDYFQGKETSQ